MSHLPHRRSIRLATALVISAIIAIGCGTATDIIGDVRGTTSNKTGSDDRSASTRPQSPDTGPLGSDKPAATPRPQPANLLFILSDDHRNDLLGVAGHPILKTPNIDKLANQGVRFTNAFVTTSICAASRASLFTGLTERTHGYTFGTPSISANHIRDSYPARLKAAGYRTGHVGKFGVKIDGNTDQMFDVFHDFDRPYWRKDGGQTIHVTNLARDLALEFLNNQPKDQPFALQVSFSAGHAHDPDLDDHYPPAREEADLYAGQTMPDPRLADPNIFENLPTFIKDSMNRDRYYWRWDVPAKYQKNMRNYLRLLSGVDRVVGDLRDKLEELGFADNTVIVFMGDNGYYMGDRGLAGKWSHYEQSLRVPLVIYDPSAGEAYQGGQSRRTSHSISMCLPSCLSWQGYDRPMGIKGLP